MFLETNVEADEENGVIEISSDTRCCYYAEDEKIIRHRKIITGDVGIWNQKMLLWQGRQDDVIKINGRSGIDNVSDSNVLVSGRLFSMIYQRS